MGKQRSPSPASSQESTRPHPLSLSADMSKLSTVKSSPSWEDSRMSTRGQHLPSILYNYSVGNLREYASPGLRYSPLRYPQSAGREDVTDVERGLRTQGRRARGEGARFVSGDGRGIEIDNVFEPPQPPPDFVLPSGRSTTFEEARLERRTSVLMKPEMRSQRLIGNSNPRYRWEQYLKSDEELKKFPKKIRQYYERNNYLVQQYLYIDRLLDSSLPRDLIDDYNLNSAKSVDVPPTIGEEEERQRSGQSSTAYGSPNLSGQSRDACNGDAASSNRSVKMKRTKEMYKVPDETTSLLPGAAQDEQNEFAENAPAGAATVPAFQVEDDDSTSRVVSVAIYINLAANTLLLALKIVVTVMTSSLSVLASLVDAALDFLSTAIVWTTTKLISGTDREEYPVGRRRLEPIGVLVFSVIMITSFFQVAIEAVGRLTAPEHELVELSVAAIAIMASTVVVKALCWLWCRLIRNSSVQALAQDAITDVVFNTFSIIFPLVGFFFKIWWLDPLGGLLLSLYVIISWSLTSRTHILNLTGCAASADERNTLLYLTMRFAHTIQRIQSLNAYHAGDKINVEVDIVLDESTPLRDSHDLGESLQYVLEAVPGVERAFVHTDYLEGNLPNHMRQ